MVMQVNSRIDHHNDASATPRDGSQSPKPSLSGSSREQEVALPAMPLLLVCSMIPVLGGMAWAGVASGLGYPTSIILTGVLGSALVLLISLTALVVMSPWTRRPISLQMTMWLAGTVTRLLATPLGAFLLYSALPLDGKALTLAVGAVHLATLLTEAAVMSRLLGRAIAPA